MAILPLKGFFQHYEWGTRNQEALLPVWNGEAVLENIPYAEFWMGSHPSLSSKVLLKSGYRDLQLFQPLPFLLKLLSIAEPLSIQLHPDKTWAEKLHAKNPRMYPDNNHKPEIALALSEFEALAGLRNWREVKSMLQKFSGGFPAESQQLEQGSEEKNLKELITLLAKYSENFPAETKDLQNNIYRQLESENNTRDKNLELFRRLWPKFSEGDLGLWMILLLQYRLLQPGEALFLGPGIPHAYLKGNIIECMANSDNVIRGGLTSKAKDIESLITLVKANPQFSNNVYPEFSDNWQIYASPAPEFQLRRLCGYSSHYASLNLDKKFAIALLWKGSAMISRGQDVSRFEDSKVYLLTPGQYEFKTEGDTELYVAISGKVQ